VDEGDARITEIALQAVARYGFALAGGYAIATHGMGQRLSAVDLFTDWSKRDTFERAANALVEAMKEHGYQVEVVARAETFARLMVVDSTAPGREPEKLELCADWRAHEPVMLAIGPVLHPDDAVANKMCALLGRAEARDFLDADAALESGRYSRERLLELAAEADAGFDRLVFAGALDSLRQITDADFDLYGVSPAGLAACVAASTSGTRP
jgi:hypothetical protein